jgi:hypothetical protein
MCSLPGRSRCCCLAALPAPPALLPLLPSALLPARQGEGFTNLLETQLPTKKNSRTTAPRTARRVGARGLGAEPPSRVL